MMYWWCQYCLCDRWGEYGGCLWTEPRTLLFDFLYMSKILSYSYSSSSLTTLLLLEWRLYETGHSYVHREHISPICIEETNLTRYAWSSWLSWGWLRRKLVTNPSHWCNCNNEYFLIPTKIEDKVLCLVQNKL